MGYCCTSLCGSGRCSGCCGELVANLCGGTSWWLGGWWEGERKDKQQEQEVKDQEQNQEEEIQEEPRESALRPEGAVERVYSPWGAGGRCAASPSFNSMGCNNNCCCNYSSSEYTTTSFNEYYILDFHYYLSRSCANHCYLILRNWGKTQNYLYLLETTTPCCSTSSQKKTFPSTKIQEATDLSEDKICPPSCGILNRNDNIEHILTGSAQELWRGKLDVWETIDDPVVLGCGNDLNEC